MERQCNVVIKVWARMREIKVLFQLQPGCSLGDQGLVTLPQPKLPHRIVPLGEK